MPRPRCCRRIGARPPSEAFKPVGVPRHQLREIVLSLDEFEAIRLADDEGLYQATAAERMGISRATFGRILESGRRKVAAALVHGRVLRITGGPVQHEPACPRCGEMDAGAPADHCPRCRAEEPVSQDKKPPGRRARMRKGKGKKA